MKTITLMIISIFTFIGINAQSSWHQVNSGVQESVYSIAFQDSLVGYATAGNKILKSNDAGENWTVYFQDTSALAYSGLAFYQDSLFLIRKDTGSHQNDILYSIQLIKQSNKTTRVIPTTEILIVEFGLKSFGNKVWIQSIDKTLEYKNGGLSIMQSEFEMFNFYEGALVGVSEYKAFTSLDSGLTWDTLTLTDPMFDLGNGGGYYVGGDTVVVFNSGFPVYNAISYDKGVSFNQKSFYGINWAIFINSQKVIGIRNYSSGGVIAKSVDGGKTATLDTLISNTIFQGTYRYSNNLMFVFGDNGVIFKSTNLGGLVGLNEKNEVNLGEIKIYPNPTSDQIAISTKGNRINQIRIVDLSGKVVFENQSTLNANEIAVPIHQLENGTYILTVTSNGQQKSEKVVVNH